MGVRRRKEGKSEGSRFKSKSRSAENTEKRRTGNNDWDSIFKQGFSIFKAKDGKNTIRIISPNLYVVDPKNAKKEIEVGWVGADYWGKDIYVHNSVGDTFTGYLCLKEMLGKPCPICEDRERAIADSDDSEEDKEYIKSLKPSQRVLIYLVDRKSDDEEVQVWSMPRFQMDMAIAKVAFDEDDNSDIPIDSPDEGYNIHFEFGKDKKSGMFGYSGVKLAKNPSAVEDEFLEYVAENPLPEVLQYYSYERIKEVHMGKAASTEDTETDTDEDEETTDTTETTTEVDNDLTYEDVQEMSEDALFEILEEKSDMKDDDLDDLDEEGVRAAVCELFDLKPKKVAAKSKAASMRKRRAKA